MKPPDKDMNVPSKTPEEIKRWLEGCKYKSEAECAECSLIDQCETNATILVYINQLESRLAQVERERDAAVRDMYALALNYESNFVCDFCGGNSPLLCEQCKIDYCGFKWRGVCAENTKEDANA